MDFSLEAHMKSTIIYETSGSVSFREGPLNEAESRSADQPECGGSIVVDLVRFDVGRWGPDGVVPAGRYARTAQEERDVIDPASF